MERGVSTADHTPPRADTSLDDLHVFFLLHAAGSLSAAARRFGASKATLSRALARLEDRAGMALFDRTRAGLKLTAAGERLLPAAKDATDAGMRAEDILRRARGTPHGALRVAASALSAQQLLGPVLARMSVEYPQVLPVVRITAQGPDPLGEDLDLVLRLGLPDEPYLIARRIVGTTLRLYASPAATEGLALADPGIVDALGRVVIDVPGSPADWTLSSASGETVTFDSPPMCLVGDPTVAVGVLRAGRGAAFMPSLFAEPLAAANALVRVLPAFEGPLVEMYATFPPRRASVLAVRVFIDLLVELTKPQDRTMATGVHAWPE